MENRKRKLEYISVVVPCFNEEESIYPFIEEFDKYIKKLLLVYKVRVELIFVDDGSRDKTLEILRDISKKNPDIRYISLSRNFGKESAMLAGFQNSKGDLIAVMDVDLQDPPEYIIEMYRILSDSDNYECVATRRITREGEPIIRSYFARMFYKIINRIADIEIVDGARDFRMMTKVYLKALLSLNEYNRFSKGLFGWIGFRTKWLEYKNKDRIAGTSKWSFWKLFLYSVDGIIAFSTVPLHILSILGLILCLIAFCFLIFIFVQKVFLKGSIEGWTSLASLVIFLGGSIIFSIGVLGQYIARIYSEVKGRPIYIIGETNIKK